MICTWKWSTARPLCLSTRRDQRRRALARYRKAMEAGKLHVRKGRDPAAQYRLSEAQFVSGYFCVRATAKAAAMASLNDVDAIIFDLRDNRGGYPGMVMLIAAYLFDHPEYMYNPRENTTEQSWTRSPVPGKQTGRQAGVRVDLGQDLFRRGALQLRLEDAETRHAGG